MKRSKIHSDYEKIIDQSAYNIDIHSRKACNIALTPVDEPFGIRMEER